MNDLRKAAEMAYEVPLHELLDGVPENARLVIDSEDGMSTRFIPVGHLCKRAAIALRQALDDKPAVKTYAGGKPNYCTPEHEPLCYLRDDIDRPFGGFEHCGEHDPGAFPVYLAPPKREWVGLTDEEINTVGQDVWVGWPSYDEEFTEIYRLLEAKLKEKNGG